MRFHKAGLGRRMPTRAAAASNRPTELALGLAVDALFQALPKETRRALNELPEVVRRLEEHAAPLLLQAAGDVRALLAQESRRL